MTTLLTIAGFGTYGNSGDESSKEQLFRNERCQKGAENVIKKFHQLFGSRMPRVRVSPLGPKCYKPLLRFIAFFVYTKRDSNNQMQRGRALPPPARWRRTSICALRRRCKRVSPLGPKCHKLRLRFMAFFVSTERDLKIKYNCPVDSCLPPVSTLGANPADHFDTISIQKQPATSFEILTKP